MSEAVEIPLTRGKVALVSPEDAERVGRFKWYADPRGYAQGRPYGRARGDWRMIKMHRFIMDVPDGLFIDHIDDDGFNNTRENLRICTAAENVRNGRRRRGKTGLRGVWPSGNERNPYRAIICVNGQRIHLGTFPVPEEAAHAYDAAALEHFGEFARLNFPQHKEDSPS